MDSALTFDPLAHQYFWRGNRVPGVTGILKEMRVAPPYPPDQGQIELGKSVHVACERLLLGRLPIGTTDSDRYPGTSCALFPYLDAFREKIKELRIRPLFTEMRVYNDIEGYAGTLDLNCIILEQEEALIDFKSGQPPECTALQLAAYDEALTRTLRRGQRYFEKTPTTTRRRRFALRLNSDGKPKLIEFADRCDYEYWRGVLWHWKFLNRKGIKTA